MFFQKYKFAAMRKFCYLGSVQLNSWQIFRLFEFKIYSFDATNKNEHFTAIDPTHCSIQLNHFLFAELLHQQYDLFDATSSFIRAFEKSTFFCLKWQFRCMCLYFFHRCVDLCHWSNTTTIDARISLVLLVD